MSLSRAAFVLLCLGLCLSAEAKQCIYNKGLLHLEVWWYSPKNLQASPSQKEGLMFSVTSTQEPIKKEQILIGQQSCITGESLYTAVVKLWTQSGCKLNFHGQYEPCSTGVRILPGTLYMYSPTAPCGDEYGCRVELGGGAAALEVYFVNLMLLTPSPTRYVDISGTTLNIDWAGGGPIQ